MSIPPTLPPRLFNLEGILLDFIGGDPTAPEAIALEVEQEYLTIHLSSALSQSVQTHLQPGDRVCCLGYSQVDWQAGLIQLQAYQVFSQRLQRPTVKRRRSEVTVAYIPLSQHG